MPFIMWVVFIQSAEGLDRTKTDLPYLRSDSAKRLPLDSNYKSYLSLQPVGLSHQILDSANLYKHMNQFLKISSSSPLYLPVYTHTSCWLKKLDIYNKHHLTPKVCVKLSFYVFFQNFMLFLSQFSPQCETNTLVLASISYYTLNILSARAILCSSSLYNSSTVTKFKVCYRSFSL